MKNVKVFLKSTESKFRYIHCIPFNYYFYMYMYLSSLSPPLSPSLPLSPPSIPPPSPLSHISPPSLSLLLLLLTLLSLPFPLSLSLLFLSLYPFIYHSLLVKLFVIHCQHSCQKLVKGRYVHVCDCMSSFVTTEYNIHVHV